MSNKASIVWFRHDLRTEDHPALHAAIEKGDPIIPVYIWAPEEEGDWSAGGASKWWLHHSLMAFKKELQALMLDLIIIKNSSSLEALREIIKITGADAVFWNRRYEPASIRRDTHIKKELNESGIKCLSFNGSLLFEPCEILNKQNQPFKVFTPFWKHCLTYKSIKPPLEKISDVKKFKGNIQAENIANLELLPKIHWEEGLIQTWKPGSENAKIQLAKAIHNVVENYAMTRDRPDLNGVSLLSPHLHFGEISPRQIWKAVKLAFSSKNSVEETFLRQLGWREFAHYLLYHFPKTPEEPLYEKFTRIPWSNNQQHLVAWQKGKTGYPLVDAGMRQLYHTGWMHNRVRMVVASFLVKDLMIPWQEGEKWFWDTLVDADLANNTLGWQWTAGCGADAAPYFRVFNPTTQGEKFDVTRSYVRKWVPEIQGLPEKWIYRPWEAPSEELSKAGITLGKDYPFPMIDHDKARKEALSIYAGLKN